MEPKTNINLSSEWINGALQLVQNQLHIDELEEEAAALKGTARVNAKKLFAEFQKAAADAQKAEA